MGALLRDRRGGGGRAQPRCRDKAEAGWGGVRGGNSAPPVSNHVRSPYSGCVGTSLF